MEIIFHSHANKTHFPKKGCAPSLSLKVHEGFWNSEVGYSQSPCSPVPHRPWMLLYDFIWFLNFISIVFVLFSDMEMTRPFTFSYFPQIYSRNKKDKNKETRNNNNKVRKISQVETKTTLY